MNCLLYADDIAIVASSQAELELLLRAAEDDSVDRGYRFSPSKCVVISPFRPPGLHKLYDIELVNAGHFNYLGVEFDSYGISEYRHVDNRIKKAEKSLLFLRQIGMNVHGFDVITCLRLYKAFVRPGLEYALPLLGSLTSTLSKLRICQKRGICGILGVDVNSRLDIIDAASGCPPFEVRQQIVRSRRNNSIRSVWQSGYSDDFALSYVLRGLLGEEAIPPSIEDLATSAQITSAIVFSQFVEPTSRSISQYTEGALTFLAVRRLVSSSSASGSNRLLLLWCLSKWRNFKPSTCHLCGSLYLSQDHIVECSDLSLKLLTDARLDGIQVSPDNPLKIVEAYVTALSDLIPTPVGAYSALADHLAEAIRLVRGTGPAATVEP